MLDTAVSSFTRSVAVYLDRYLTLLAAEGISYVLVDGTALPEVYGRSEKGHGLVPMRALPIVHPDRFPAAAVWATLVHLCALRLGRGAMRLRWEAAF